MGSSEDGTTIGSLLWGRKYMVIDMGGGTVDIAVCELEPEMTVKVLHKASGGGWGGTEVDKEFFQFITSLTGQEVFSELCRNNQLDHLELQREFEVKKRNIGSQTTGMIYFRTTGLFERYKDETGKDFKETVDEWATYRENVSYRRGKLNIDAFTLKTFFTPCCEKVVRHISDILKTTAAKGIQILLLTGGFSNSELMQNAVANAFPNLRVLVPENPDEAVLRGAVIFGHSPQSIKTRVVRLTYGMEITPLFDPSVHSQSRRVSVNGQDRCKNVFRKFVGSGETVVHDFEYCQEHATIIPYQEEMVINIYYSECSNPMYVDEDAVFMGRLTIGLPKREKSVFNVKMSFGSTEMTATAVDLQNKTETSCTLDFLG